MTPHLIFYGVVVYPKVLFRFGLRSLGLDSVKIFVEIIEYRLRIIIEQSFFAVGKKIHYAVEYIAVIIIITRANVIVIELYRTVVIYIVGILKQSRQIAYFIR